MIGQLIGALIGAVYGCCTVFRKKTPLFYRIIFFAVLTGLMGAVYTLLYTLLWEPAATGFHVGYLGSIGMFFFLFSSYYGALDSLADDHSPALRRYRLTAGLVAVVFFLLTALSVLTRPWLVLVLLPVGCSLHFALKHLIIPDVEMGIIRVMRPYNSIIVVLCCATACYMLSDGLLRQLGDGITGLALALCLPLARNGVRKWYI